ncbi:DUF1471 domain-containing protein [Vagococcus sp. WN89Y]|uniref:DUF1471 domain-containing protein n=1 Tax=Vagococcus sp. WN89Y TaxID=3457258 RepID=UPI003FCC7988
MKYIILFLTTLLFCTNAAAAIKINDPQALNMDDVQSLGVIYINHNFSTERDASQALEHAADAQGAKYYHEMLIREPGSNGNMHASAAIYR